ncbi:MFS general substrate transporter [Myriangium duriaei CBS 260.36]|uniref:MFS general substrate transporter n=1 Tax=Myriangium duriaei CBS 260.36 TaxID=1168546 RepID=A0A9P4IUA1_9PEZI|nr:MFS general substrate transporter [Myriangium duriaei CBS 260.36]
MEPTGILSATARSSFESESPTPGRNGRNIGVWSRPSLLAAYFGLYLLAYVTSLEGQVTLNLTVFAASAFQAHSLVSTVYVVGGVVFSVAKPIMAKVADVFGRFKAFSLCAALLTLGYITQAASGNFKIFTASSVFYSAGATGLQILQQIFIADTSTLRNRAILSTIPDIPFVVNVWIGAPLASLILQGPGWRWGYGIWAIILPITFLPLAFSLLREKQIVQKSVLQKPFVVSAEARMKRSIWHELDAGGLLLLTVAISLILIPLTLQKDGQDGWGIISIGSMLILGLASLVAFWFWERDPRLAPRPFFPAHLSKDRTVLAGFGISFFFAAVYYLSVFPYFQSYLLVVSGESVASAGQIVQLYVFVSTITAIIVSFLIKFVHRYKYFVVSGSCIYSLGCVLTAIYRIETASRSTIVLCQIAIGIGGGLMVVPAQLGVQASVSHGEVATTTALFLTTLEIGGAAGSSLAGAIWAHDVPPKLQQYLPQDTKNQASVIFGNITLASTGWPTGDPTRAAIIRAYQETMTKMLIAAVCACVPLVPLSLMMKNHKLDEMDQNDKDAAIGGDQELADFDEREPLARDSCDSRTGED